jgi:serine/threonine protein kinase
MNQDKYKKITFKFTPLKDFSTNYCKKLTISELEQILFSKFRIGENIKRNTSIFKLNEKDYPKAKTNLNSLDNYEIDLNQLLELLFDSNSDDNSLIHAPFIPINEIELSKDSFGSGSFGELIKCSYHNGSKGLNYAFKAFKSEINDYETFLKEVKAYSKLNHPGVPKFVGVSYDSDKKHGFIMEFINGNSLDKCIDSIDEIEKLEYAYQLSDVISYLHSNDCIHRDLKPDNIMIKVRNQGEKQQLFLIDYGLSRISNDNNNNRLQTMRTVFKDNENVYRFLNEDDNIMTNKAIDIWSLGCIIYFLYTKKHPCDLNLKSLVNLARNNNYFFRRDEINNDFIYDLIKDCCDYDLSKRKSAIQIKEKIYRKLHYGNEGN